jgi:intron-binding protein aquarius
LNIQFLTLHDYLLRNFQLYKLEAAYSIRQDIQDAILRVNPVYNPDAVASYDKTIFAGWARMATPLHQLQIEEVGTPRLTETIPSFVKADITYTLDRYKTEISDEWDTLRPHDTLFLISLQMMPDLTSYSVTEPLKKLNTAISGDVSGQVFKKRYGIKHVRGCEIFQILGDDGQPVYDFKSGKELDKDGVARIATKSRTLRVLLDPNQYVDDLKSCSDIYDIYGNINLILRRNASQNNFKSVLETIRDLMQSELVVPEWLQDILLGYGERNSAHFTKMANPTTTIDFGYTFLNWSHLSNSFPGQKLIPIKGKNSPDLIPPYVLTFPGEEFEMLDAYEDGNAKRKAENLETGIVVKSYRFKSLIESPKVNKIAFTPAQGIFFIDC